VIQGVAIELKRGISDFSKRTVCDGQTPGQSFASWYGISTLLNANAKDSLTQATSIKQY